MSREELPTRKHTPEEQALIMRIDGLQHALRTAREHLRSLATCAMSAQNLQGIAALYAAAYTAQVYLDKKDQIT